MHEYESSDSPDRVSHLNLFWIGNATVGYRLPHRWGAFVLEGRNLSNRQFDSFDREVEDTFIPARSVTMRFTLAY